MTYSFERKNIDTEGVHQWSFIKNICERMIKPAVNTPCGSTVHAEEDCHTVKTK